MQELTSSATVKIVTPAQANSWLNKANYSKQRTVRAWWVEFLAEEMTRGSFQQGTAITFMRSNGSMKLVDGQHRLAAVVKSQMPQQFTVIVIPVDGHESVDRAYYRLDQSLRRTAADQYRCLDLDTELGITKTQLNAVGAACGFIHANFLHSSHGFHPDDREQMIRDYTDAASLYFEIRAGSPQPIQSATHRKATLAIAMVTLRYSVNEYGEDKVIDFWHGAIHDDEIPSKDARKAANRHLWTVSMIGASSRMTISATSPNYSARYLANCFNAWVEDRPIASSKVYKPTAPIKINGSPFTGE